MKSNFYRVVVTMASLFCFTTLVAQVSDQNEDDTVLEEVTVVGSQIRGAKITGALPVSIFDFSDIEAIGVDSGDELLESIVENGMNFFAEAEDAAGGVNAGRGDMGAYNLRNMGVGNTLTLLNGRRLVNSPGYQTELLGGDYVPTMTVNSNLIPVYGLDRMEILRDGASAIYGADAVAGVVNNVIQKDYEGFMMRTKIGSYQHFDAQDTTFSGKFGKNFNDGATNISVFFDVYNRDRINASEDARWGAGDHRPFLKTSSPWYDGPGTKKCSSEWTGTEKEVLPGECDFRNNSVNSLYGQFDMKDSKEHGAGSGSLYPEYDRVFNDSNGEFEVHPLGDPRCSNRSSQDGAVFDTGFGTCIAQDGNGSDRYNFWGGTDTRSDLKRNNIFVFLNHDFGDGVEAFSEFGLYTSKSNRRAHPSYAFTSSKHRVGPDNYYLNQMKLADGTPLYANEELYIDYYRYAEKDRIVDVDKKTYRFLQGLRGSTGDWDAEGAILYSVATSDDITHNRVSNTLLKEALLDSTSAAYNPFSAGVNSNIERTLVDVYRLGRSKLFLVDMKLTNNNFMELPAGPLGVLLGAEIRYESVSDNRDPRLDGTTAYVDYEGDTYPMVSDVLNSSPTGDVKGDRHVNSLFMETQIPLINSLDAQIALRVEDFSDVEDTAIVGKFALGWQPTDWFLLRASTSSAFRPPNIIQINEKQVVRSGTKNDYAMIRVEQLSAAGGDDLDSRRTIQRHAVGAQNLVSEESDNTSIGFVLTPQVGAGNLTLTVDAWTIKKENTIGLFGRENQTVNDMVLRIANGTNNCDTFTGNPAVTRLAMDWDEEELGWFTEAGVCPFGKASVVTDEYLNLATRTIEGYDVGFYYNLESDVGDFSVRYIASHISKFDQTPGGAFSALAAQQASGAIPAEIPLGGFGDLALKDGNYDNKHYLRVSWRKGSWGAAVTGLKKGSFYQNSLTLPDGTRYVIPSMTTMDFSLDYRFDVLNVNQRIRFSVKNAMDERAPLADRYYGYFADAHQDWGRNYYLDYRVSF